MSEDFKFRQFIVFLFARCLFGEFFDDFRHCNISPSEGKCLRRKSIPVRLHCPFENCHKSYNSKKHINEHFLSTAMDRHVLNSKQHLRPHAVVGFGVKIFGRGLFMTSPDHLVCVSKSTAQEITEVCIMVFCQN